MNQIKNYTIEDCKINFHNLFEIGYAEFNDKVTKDSILNHCNTIDNSWYYICDDSNNPPSIIDDNDCILEMYKKIPNSASIRYFKFSFKDYAIEIGLLSKNKEINESN